MLEEDWEVAGPCTGKVVYEQGWTHVYGHSAQMVSQACEGCLQGKGSYQVGEFHLCSSNQLLQSTQAVGQQREIVPGMEGFQQRYLVRQLVPAQFFAIDAQLMQQDELALKQPGFLRQHRQQRQYRRS